MENTTKKIIKRLACVTSALIIAGGAVIYSINKTQQKTIATLGKATDNTFSYKYSAEVVYFMLNYFCIKSAVCAPLFSEFHIKIFNGYFRISSDFSLS